MRLLRPVLLTLGVGLLVALVVRNDPAAVLASLGRLSWRFVVILLFPVSLVSLFDALGWRYAFRRDREPLAQSEPSVIIAKTTITLAQGIFLLLGIVLATFQLGRSPLLLGMQWLLGLEVLALAIFIVVQGRGMVGWSARLLARLGLPQVGAGTTAAQVDRALRDFYLRAPGRLALSIAFHLVAWLLGAVEAYLILAFLGIPVSLATATVIEAFGTGIRFATFLVPASIGVQEGGFVVTFVALGLNAADGVTFGLVRRLRELVWIAFGLALFARERREPVVAPPSTVD